MKTIVTTSIGSLAALFLLSATGAAQSLPRPAWLRDEPLIIVGGWDDMPIFRRRVGGNPVWQEEDYRREHTEEAVEKLKELGVTMAVIHFYKGFGLAAEKEHMDDARRLAALCKKHGLRVGVYIGSTIAYETFLLEKPDATAWFVQPFLGRPVLYGDQTFRKRAYFMHPGYREYMKEVLRIAIQDLMVDLIHFDNTSMQAQAPIFLHPLAVSDFRDYLRKKYSPEMLKRRLGFSDVRYVEPPEVDRVPSVINDPMWQEWAGFRCAQLTAYYGEMEHVIRGLNPETAVECNPHSGISGHNTVWEQGIDYPELLSHMDVVWSEEGNEAGVTPDGILISKIRTYKMAQTLGNRIFTYTGATRAGTTAIAEAMAYNPMTLGEVGGGLAGYETPEEERRYIRFYVSNFPLYRRAEHPADVAVLHSYASMAFNHDLPWQSSMLMEQALIQNRIPFDIIFDANLRDLSKYRVLVLADQECLSDEQMESIRRFVNGGGGLVATELSSLYTPWRERRREFGLHDLFKIQTPRWMPSRTGGEEAPDIAPVRNTVGQGRVAYLARITPAIAKPAAAAMTSQYWKLPVNSQEVIAAVKWAAGDNLSLDVKAPQTVTAELTSQKDEGRFMIHLVNFDKRAPVAGRIEVSLRIPEGKQVEQVTLLSPDEKAPQTLTPVTRSGRAVFAVSRLKTYAVAVIRLRK